MKQHLCAFALLLGLGSAHAEDFFPNDKLRSLATGTPVAAGDTIGGYPIFMGDKPWFFSAGALHHSSGAAVIPMGNVLLLSVEKDALLALQSVTANLRQDGDIASWTGSPCSAKHLASRNKGAGLEDNCMTLDPTVIKVRDQSLVMLTITVTMGGHSGRLLTSQLGFNAEALGFQGSKADDWTHEAVQQSPQKQALVAKLRQWAELLQDATGKAFSYAKPQDAYSQVPPIQSLLAGSGN